jgi:alpha-tubulin suppressor-like RCC1 family protein
MRKSLTLSSFILKAALLCAAALPAVAQEDVSWIDTAGASATGSTLQKNGPAGWGSGGRSSRSLISGDGSIAFAVLDSTTAKACGFTRGGFGYEEMDYGILLGADGGVAVVELGVTTPLLGTHASGDRFEIAVEGSAVLYRQNGSLLHTSATPPQYPLTAAAALDTPGASIADVVLTGALAENVRWAAAVNATAVGSDLIKSAGAANTWDAAAVSTKAIVSPNGYVEVTASETSTNRMLGLSHGQTNQAYADIDYALYMAGNRLYVYESGVQRGSFGTFVAGDRLRVAVEGASIRYRRNGTLLYASAVAPTFPLLVDTSLYSLGATLQDAVLTGDLQTVAAAPPSFSVPTGHHLAAQSVVITASDPAAEIHVTTSGADPTQSDPVVASGESVLVDLDLTLKARAWVPGLIPSSVTSASYTFGPTTAEQVVWTAAVNTTAVGSNLRKSTGASNTWDAGAVSTKAIVSVDGYVEVLASETNTNRMFGLSHGDTNQAYADIDYALYMAGNRLYVYEAGVQRGAFGTFAAGDLLRVAIEGGILKYRRNGQLLCTSGVAPSFPLLVDTSLYSIGATLQDVVISGKLQTVAASPPGFSIPTGHYPAPQSIAITSSDTAAEIHVTTSGADPTQSDPLVASGESVQVSTDLALKARVWVPGLIPSGVASATYTFGPTTAENVVWTAAVNAAAAGNDLAKSAGASSAWDAGAVSTKGIVSMDGYAELVASETSTNRMFGLSHGETNQAYADIDFAWYLAGSRLYVYEAGVQRGSFGTFATGDRLRVAVEGGVVKYLKGSQVLYTSGVAPTFPLLVDTSIYSIGATLHDVVISGALQTVAASPPSFSLLTGHYLTARSVIITSSDSGAEIHVSTTGADPTQSDPVVPSGGSVLVDTNLTLKARAWVPSLIPSSVTSATYTFGPTSVEDVVWTAAANATATGNDLTKSGGTPNAWDAGAVSTKGIVSMDGFVEVTASETNKNRMFGLSHGETNQAYGDIDFAWYLAGNRLYVYEAGVQRGSFGGFVTGDRLRVAVEGGIVKYLKNGGLFYTSGVAPTLPLLVDTSFYSASATLQDAVLSGALQSMLVGAPVFTPPPGTYTAADVAISSPTPGSEIRYTLDGSDPSPTSTLYSAPIALSGPTTIKARAFRSDLLPSEVMTGTYGLRVATPTISPAPGSYSSPQSVTLTCATAGAAIHYSLDGSEPSEASRLYASPIQITTSSTILARAFRAGFEPSEIVSGTYSIAPAAVIEAGADHSLLLMPDRTVRAWGHNSDSELGDGTTENRPGPVVVPDLTDVTSVSASYHNLAIKSDRTLWVWGAGWSGQLGLGTTDNAPAPVRVPDLAGIVSVSAGDSHSLALDSTGHVWAFGSNWSGELGLGTSNEDVLTPVQVPGLAGITAISGGGFHSLALDSAGHVWASGYNEVGQLGLGTTDTGLTPVQVPGLSGITAISAGRFHSLALDSAGHVWAFGYNQVGQLGLGTTDNALLPVAIPGLTDITAISAGGYHSLALDSTGRVWAFGANWSGQLGLGTIEDGLTPAQVPGLTGVVAVSAGGAHSLALTADGTVLSWGANDSGQLGNWTTDSRTSPVAATLPGLVFSVGAPTLTPSGGRFAGPVAVTARCAIPDATMRYTLDGTEPTEADPLVPADRRILISQSATLTVKAWRAAYEPGTAVETYEIVQATNTTPGIAAGRAHSVAVRPDGTVWAWGDGSRGQLGSGADEGSLTPRRVEAAPIGTSIAAGADHVLAIDESGILWAWGANQAGQLGDGSTQDRLLPVRVSGLTNVVAVAGGTTHTLALKSDGSVWAWGGNDYGQLGLNSTTPSPRPVQVPGLSDVIAIAAGEQHSLAVLGDGSVWAWGGNDYGQLGDGSTTPSYTPVEVEGLPRIEAIAAGAYHSLAMDADGVAWAWGANWEGQLGDGTWDDQAVPVKVKTDCGGGGGGEGGRGEGGGGPSCPAVSGVEEISAGAEHSLALLGDGSVLAWGGWAGGWSAVAQPVYGLGPWYDVEITRIAAGHYHSLALAADGTLWSWQSDDPVRISGPGLSFKAQTPRFLTIPGTYSAPVQVAIAGSSDTVIRFTTDGTVPTEASPPYVGPVPIGTRTTLTARAFGAFLEPSNLASAVYSFNFGALALSSSPPAGRYVSGVSVALAAAHGASVFYTVDGSDPVPGYAATLTYSGPIGIEVSTTIRAIATHVDWASSAPFAATYTIQVARPTITPEGGAYSAGQPATLSSPTTGATIHYTLDGSEPTELDPIIGPGEQVFLGNFTLKAIATKTGCESSPVMKAEYLVTGALGQPSVAAAYHSLLVEADGTVWAWGLNDSGQLGIGSLEPQSRPVPVKGLTGIVRAAASASHNIALGSDGTLWAWGSNGYGQIGDGTTEPRLVPVHLAGLAGATAVAAGSDHSLALRTDGTVWTWGQNWYGQLGNGSYDRALVPTQVPGVIGATAVAAGGYHSLAVTGGGTVFAWGRNSAGQLGNGRTTSSPIPVSVTGLTGVTAVAASWTHSLALKSDGTVWAWGANESGQLGDETTDPRTEPVQVHGLSEVRVIAIAAGDDFSLALDDDGGVWAWGTNGWGQLGIGTTSNYESTPVKVATTDAIASIAAGQQHSLALATDGSLLVWGRNNHGQLGDGTTNGRLTPGRLERFWLTDDPDHDGLTTAQELALGTDPYKWDTNGDGSSDGASVALGISPTNMDVDGDGVTNAEELLRGTHPMKADTDGDGVPDGVDCYPLDPGRSECPVPDPNDTTPPTIVLLEPTTARLLTSIP